MIDPTMPDLLMTFQTHLTGNGRAARTLDTYTKVAASFLRGCSARLPTRTDVESFLGRNRRDGQRRAPAGRNQELAALRSLAACAVEGKRWPSDPTKGIEFARKVRHDPAFLDEEELGRFFLAARDRPPAGETAQCLAILGVLSQRGLRIREAVALDVTQLDLVAKQFLGVRGKGGTIANLLLNDATIALLAAWIRERATRAPTGESALFISSRGTRLAARTVENWFVKLRAAMGTTKKVTPHTLRHSFATIQLWQGADVATVAGNMRHADINSTLWYLHMIDVRQREAVQRLASTVPRTVLDGVAALTPASVPPEKTANDARLAPLERPESSQPDPLDGQYRMVARKRPPEADGSDGQAIAA